MAGAAPGIAFGRQRADRWRPIGSARIVKLRSGAAIRYSALTARA